LQSSNTSQLDRRRFISMRQVKNLRLSGEGL